MDTVRQLFGEVTQRGRIGMVIHYLHMMYEIQRISALNTNVGGYYE